MLELRTFDFKENPIISLHGNWKFYPNQLVDDSHPAKEELDFLSEILTYPSDTKLTFASSKEMKLIISKIQEELHGLGTDQDTSENVADLFFSCGIISPLKHWIEYLKNPKNRELLEWAAQWRGVMVKLTGIHDASERVSKIVQSLKTYTHNMNPSLFFGYRTWYF